MKLFKPILFSSITLVVLAILFLIFSPKVDTFHPISEKNDFYQKLSLAINTSQLKTSSFDIRDFNNQIEFYIVDNQNSIKIILSDEKDPFWQIASLQEILKTAKINQQTLKLVDLSPAHPYATFKNN